MFEGSKISRPLSNSTLRVCEVREKVVDKTRATKDNNLPSPTILMIVQKEEKMFKVGIIKNLVEDNYEEIISLEPEYEDKTGGRVESSRQCLAGIRKILSSLGIQLESYYE